MNEQNEQEKFIKEWDEICKKEIVISMRKREIMEKTAMNMQKLMSEKNIEESNMEEIASKKQRIIGEIMKQMAEKDEKNTKLQNDNSALKEKMANMKAFYVKELKLIHRRQIPIELMNELFASLPLENAFGLLTKMPNGLLARNVQKMIESIKMALKDNKWNEEEHGSKLAILDEGKVIVHSGLEGSNSIRTVLPIPLLKLAIKKSTILFYFEMEILKKPIFMFFNMPIAIGFCTKEFPLEGQGVGFNNSIGFYNKETIWIDKYPTKLGNSRYQLFMERDVIGFGIIQRQEIHQWNILPHAMANYWGRVNCRQNLPNSNFILLSVFPMLVNQSVQILAKKNGASMNSTNYFSKVISLVGNIRNKFS